MSHALPTLSELIAGYPEDAPQYGPDLLAADRDTLPPIAAHLQRHIASSIKSVSEWTIESAHAAKRHLELGHIQPLARKWATYALDANRARVMKAFGEGGKGRAAVRVVTRRVPSAEQLRREAMLPAGGTYLVFYGGSPSVLDVRDNVGGGVADDIARLKAEAPIADVLFWHLESGQAPTLYSLLAGVGDQGGAPREFPNPHWLAVARGEPAPETNLGGTS